MRLSGRAFVAPRTRAAALGLAAASGAMSFTTPRVLSQHYEPNTASHYSHSQFTGWKHKTKFPDSSYTAKTCKISAKATESTSPPVLPHLQNIKCTSAELKDEKLQVLK